MNVYILSTHVLMNMFRKLLRDSHYMEKSVGVGPWHPPACQSPSGAWRGLGSASATQWRGGSHSEPAWWSQPWTPAGRGSQGSQQGWVPAVLGATGVTGVTAGLGAKCSAVASPLPFTSRSARAAATRCIQSTLPECTAIWSGLWWFVVGCNSTLYR